MSAIARFGLFDKLACVGLLVLMATACSGSAAHPEDAMRAYVDDVRNHRAEAVYDVIGEDLRGEMSKADFQVFFNENYDEILAQAELIEASIDEGKMEIVAALPMNEHSEIALQFEENHWVLADDVRSIAGSTSPRGTITALADAIETKDLDAIIELLSQEKGDTLQAELAILRRGLKGVSEDDIVINGDIATVYLDWGGKLELTLEDGVWHLSRLPE